MRSVPIRSMKASALHVAAVLCFSVSFSVTGQEAPEPVRVTYETINDAAAAGDLDRVKDLLEGGSDIDSPMMKRRGGKTPLALAVEKNHTLVVKYLLEMGADLDRARFVLHTAARRGNLEMCRILVEAGANGKQYSNEGWTPLHHAARHGRTKVIEYLVNTGTNVNRKSRKGNRPLHLAFLSSPGTVSLLIDLGANVRITDNRGVSPFEMACRIPEPLLAEKILSKVPAAASAYRQDILDKGFREALTHNHLEMEKILIEKGANLEVQAYGGYGLLHLASEFGHVESAALLLGEGADVNLKTGKARWTPLHFACSNGRVEVFQLLIKHGADPEALDAMNRTPLHLASEGLHISIVSELLKGGADANIQDKDENLPLHYAAATAQDTLIRLLAVNTADLEVKNSSGNTALAIAANAGRARTGSVLAEVLASRNSRSSPDYHHEVMNVLVESVPETQQDSLREVIERSLEKGGHLLHIAAKRNSLPAVRTILRTDVSKVGARDPYGYLAIHAAADMGYLDIVSSLLSEGASVGDQENVAEWSPLHFAVSKGHTDVAEALLGAGADAGAMDGNGWTPADFAFLNQHESMIALLRTKAVPHQ